MINLDHSELLSDLRLRGEHRAAEVILQLICQVVETRQRLFMEREECAKVCDDWPNGRDDVYSIGVAIRARGEK